MDEEFLEDVRGWSSTSDPSSPTSIDLVFVHGLNPRSTPDFARATWTHANGTFWPDSLLSSFLPQARPLLFSYNSRVADDVSNNNIKQHARNLLNRLSGLRDPSTTEGSRLIIFVAHSLGGLVVKQAILHARDDDSFKDILQSTRGLVFFGVPHRGGNGAGIGAIVKNIVTALSGEGRNDLVESLQKNSLFQEQQAERFRERLEDFQVISVVEDLETELVSMRFLRRGMIIVDQQSATLGLPGTREKVLTVNSNHSDVCRFAADGAKFRMLKIELIRLVTALEPRAIEKSRPLVHSLPFSRNPKFVGRRKELKQLHEILFGPDREHCAALVGLGGAGKTQIARAFAFEVSATCSVFWTSAISARTFDDALRQVARRLGLKTSETLQHNGGPAGEESAPVRELIQDYLSSDAAGEWLLIIDNADSQTLMCGSDDELERAISDCLPHSALGRILLTTRTSDVARSMTTSMATVEVAHDDPQLAHELLAMHLKGSPCLYDENINVLLGELAFLPLAIVQAAGYIQRNRVSVAQYIARLQAADAETVALLSRKIEDSTRYRGSVARTWLVSFEQIRVEDPPAAELLAFMSSLEPRAIPIPSIPDCGTREGKDHAVGTLVAYRFIHLSDPSFGYYLNCELNCELHRLVHLAAGVWVKEQGLAQFWTQRALDQFTLAFPVRMKDWSAHIEHVRADTLLLHIPKVMRNADPASPSSSRLLTLLKEWYRWPDERFQIIFDLHAERHQMLQDTLDESDAVLLDSRRDLEWAIAEKKSMEAARRMNQVSWEASLKSDISNNVPAPNRHSISSSAI